MDLLFYGVGMVALLSFSVKHARLLLRLEDMETEPRCVRFQFTLRHASSKDFPTVVAVTSPNQFRVAGAYFIPVGPRHYTYTKLRFLGDEDVSDWETTDDGALPFHRILFEIGALPPGTYVLGVVTDPLQQRHLLTQEVL